MPSHKHTLPWVNKTPSEACLTFTSRLCVLQPSPTILFLPLARVFEHISRHPSLCFPTRYLFPLFQSQSSALFSAHTPSNTHACTSMRPAKAGTPLHLPVPQPTQHFSPVLSCFPSTPLQGCALLLWNSHQQRCFPRVRKQDFLSSLELINSKVAALDKLCGSGSCTDLWEKQQSEILTSVFNKAGHGAEWKQILHAFPLSGIPAAKPWSPEVWHVFPHHPIPASPSQTFSASF